MTDIRTVVVEITTQCNFTCDYCYTKVLPNRMMEFDQFKAIVDPWLTWPTKLVFSLCGEGEPLLHPQLWEFVEYIKTNSSHGVAFITNASAMTEYHRQLIANKLCRVSISLDTMDAELADRVGRHYHEKVIANITELLKIYPSHLITILTTDFGQDITGVRQFARSHNMMHSVQTLITKTDYVSVYTQFNRVVPIVAPNHPVICSMLPMGMVMYNMNGEKLPCCFIKDDLAYPGYDYMIKTLSDPNNTKVPSCCTGCKYLSPPNVARK